MARQESIALAGYFPLPKTVIHLIAASIVPRPSSTAILDPCAGEGEALLRLGEAFPRAGLHAVEMEQTRCATLKGKGSVSVTHSDAFMVDYPGHADIVLLNPPYDTDPVHGRLEHKWLTRFASVVAHGGLLVYVVPYYALAVSAELLSEKFSNVECFRFPSTEWGAYKQVVLFATGSAGQDPDSTLVEKVNRWASAPMDIPELGVGSTNREVTSNAYFGSVKVHDVDLKALVAAARPWHVQNRKNELTPVAGLIPTAEDVRRRQYPLASPPRPAHIAVGLAAGIFNGVEISSANAALPTLLMKGSFTKEYRTVEEKTNSKGEVVAHVQVQAPKLVTYALDLDTFAYHEIQPSAVPTGSDNVSEFSMADLLENYGEGMMAAMRDQCPVLHDPAVDDDKVHLVPVTRPLYTAQASAAKTIVQLLGGDNVSIRRRRNTAAILLGEIGSGKTSVSLSVLKTIKAQRSLVLCPPHLLDGWREQVEAVTPECRVVVLQTVKDVDALATSEGRVIAILSRETAKLSHRMAANPKMKKCPKCGAPVKATAADIEKRRLRCDAKIRQRLSPLASTLSFIQKERRRQQKDSSRAGVHLRKVLSLATARAVEEGHWTVVGHLLALTQSTKDILQVVQTQFPTAQQWERTKVLDLLLMLKDRDLAVQTATDLGKKYPAKDQWSDSVGPFMKKVETINEGGFLWGDLSFRNKVLSYKDIGLGEMSHLFASFKHVLDDDSDDACGEPLYQSCPEPRRVALADYIVAKHRGLFDSLILDEGHEYGTVGSAQEVAAHRLTALGVPTMLMTGTMMNGYADSLFANMWALSKKFREEFPRDAKSAFMDRYGYHKRVLEQKNDEGEVVEFGSASDRRQTVSRVSGRAPGVLPLFLFEHLLSMSVTLQKQDLTEHVPECEEIRVSLTATPTVMQSEKDMKRAIVQQMRKDKKTEKAGVLLGALANLPAYADVCTVGNQPESHIYEARYPDSHGGALVATGAYVDPTAMTPKEAWMVERVKTNIAEGRNTMVFGVHRKYMTRLTAILEKEVGETCPLLDASKVPTKTRQAWITKTVVKAKRKVMVVNPVTVQTGLNNLIHFSDIIVMENPQCNPTVYRQAIGRVDRIGQTKKTRVWFPVYTGLMQDALHGLLFAKVAVSTQTDGLDPEAALSAAGIGEGVDMSSMSIGRFLFQISDSA